MEYEIGDTITYWTFSGTPRTVKVTLREKNIKNDCPGFEGVMTNGDIVWGYDSQIVSKEVKQ